MRSYRRGRESVQRDPACRRSQRWWPFKNHFTRQKDHADRHPTNAADPAYVFVPPQLKYAQHCSSPFHTTFILTKQKPTRAIQTRPRIRYAAWGRPLRRSERESAASCARRLSRNSAN
jgi:hypothetical protein